MSDLVRADMTVSGKVQGVFYRASCQAEAMRLGVMGEVRNLPGGEVEVIAEGERPAVEELVVWCRHGPPSAEVENVTVRWSHARGEFRTFMVSR